ncbi:MAG: uncharacterized metal-binding protein YceD (DUF177 family) [Myxococcota bacterium]
MSPWSDWVLVAFAIRLRSSNCTSLPLPWSVGGRLGGLSAKSNGAQGTASRCVVARIRSRALAVRGPGGTHPWAGVGSQREVIVRVEVMEIPRGGRQLAVTMDTDWAIEAATDALDVAPDSLGGAVDISFPERGNRVDVRCRLSATAARPCDRCGEPVAVQVETNETLLYFRAGTAQEGGGELELDSSDLEVGWYEDGAIEVGDVVREALALALPLRLACAERADCDARTALLLARAHDGAPSGHPAFAALLNLQ